uniref:SDR family NAD(P)-dependent oxidoreductase n=1 Tax=Globodera pallida TaxID=36090 RepID=A0A183C3E9_GLOPA
MPEIESNKKALITGANQGIGLHTALLLANKGFDITLACRNEERAREAMKQIRKQNPDIQVQWMQVDLAELNSVRDMVERIRERKCFFDVVILNAGVLLPKTTKTVDGHEQTFQVNFLAHFLLVEGIIEHQCPDKPLRVITLTSIMHRLCGNLFSIEKDPSKWGRMFAGARRWKAYALSKFATALLAQHLNTRAGVTAFAVHPGAVKTQMADGVGSKSTRKLLFFFKHMLIEPEAAAENVVFCVLNDLNTNEYRHGDRSQKFFSAACKTRNVDALVRLALQLTAPLRAQLSPAPAA